MVQAVILKLNKLGPLPEDAFADVAQLQILEGLLSQIERPVSNEDARILIDLFPMQDSTCHGLAWSLLHAIETAPGWPLKDCLDARNGYWIEFLKKRCLP